MSLKTVRLEGNRSYFLASSMTRKEASLIFTLFVINQPCSSNIRFELTSTAKTCPKMIQSDSFI